MSFYTVRHSAPRDFVATTGWDREYHTYWFVTFHKNRPGSVNDRLSTHGGDDEGDEIPTLYELLDRTWGFIRWDLELRPFASSSPIRRGKNTSGIGVRTSGKWIAATITRAPGPRRPTSPPCWNGPCPTPAPASHPPSVLSPTGAACILRVVQLSGHGEESDGTRHNAPWG